MDTQYSIRIAPGVNSSISGSMSGFVFTAANLVGGSDGGGLRGSSSSNGIGVYGQSHTSAGVVGRATGPAGVGGVFESTRGAAVRLKPTSTLPATKQAGDICYHTTHKFCFSDGTNWYVPSGWTQVS